MNSQRTYAWAVLILASIGTLMSGYVSVVKFMSETCPTASPCPYVFGYPACYFGLVAFLTTLLFAKLRLYRLMDGERANTIIFWLSLAGTLFSGYLTLGEIDFIRTSGPTTCLYGLLIFAAIFVLSYKIRKNSEMKIGG
jgi:uncharacterized membrane protein